MISALKTSTLSLMLAAATMMTNPALAADTFAADLQQELAQARVLAATELSASLERQGQEALRSMTLETALDHIAVETDIDALAADLRTHRIESNTEFDYAVANTSAPCQCAEVPGKEAATLTIEATAGESQVN
jgi:hypothetical protein